jgi:SpoVK/Ycf46/Vps4 family AAA+-type ATPase
MLQYLVPSKHGLTILQFAGGMHGAFANFTSGPVVSGVSAALGVLVLSLGTQPLQYGIQMVGIIAMVFVIESLAVNSRSKYKGTKAVMVGIGYPLLYFGVGAMFRASVTYILPLASFAVGVALVYLLELYNVNIVKALDVRKQDIRMKFGEAFEDLHSGDVSETFASIGDYEATKRELHDAIISPLEERGIARAYKINPAKGILLFGPPGTGKTMMMRALANEVHAGFFLVKTSNLISAFSGETERLISNVFIIAKKNAPSVLFFDEIDSIAKSRDSPDVDEVHKQALTQLLMEIDGFQSATGVIVVGATNMPQLLDRALMRPGRLDKIIYMPLPDFNGRKKIFEIYLKGLPLGDSVDIEDLAEKTERYSGADIKGICEGASQVISLEATEQHKVLEISQDDILSVIKSMKPSTSLAQLETYNKFKIDFERRLFEEGKVEKTEKTSTSDVVGLEDVKKAVVEAIETPLMHPELVKKYDIKVINGILLFGPPGTGKTMIMRAVANDMKGVTMLEINGAELSTANAESAVSVLREIFNRARENVPAIIFIDEIDTVIPKREANIEISSQVTGALLEEMDGIKKLSGVLVIAATNRPEKLDPAILRPGRFDKITFVRPPNAEERGMLFRMYLKNVPVSDDLDFKKLGIGTKGFTGADISSICREAKIRALEASVKSGEEVKIGTHDIEVIISSVKPSASEETLSGYLEFMTRYGER